MAETKYTGSPVKGNMKNTGMGFPQIKRGVDQVEFGGSPSIPLQGGEVTNKYNVERRVASTPGVVKYSYMPIFGAVPGQSTLASLNEGLQAFWRSIRSATPHAENYQPGDFVTLTSVTGSIIYSLAYARAALKSLELQLGLNTYVNDGLWRVYFRAPVNAQINTYSNKFPGWVKQYDAIINKMKSVPIPDVFPIFHRWEYMSETIFRDHKDEMKAQYIMFAPTHYYDWELRPATDPGTDLVPHPIDPSDFDDFLDKIFKLAVKLTTDSSLSNMFSDLVLTYPEAQWLKWNTLKESKYCDQPFKTVYDVDVLYALHNAQIANVNAPVWTIMPKTGAVQGFVNLPDGKKALGFNPPILNGVIDDKIDSERFTILSQWVLFDPKAEYSTSTVGVDIINTPTEILAGIEIYAWKWVNGGVDRQLDCITMAGNYAFQYGTNTPYSDTNSYSLNCRAVTARSALLSWAWAPMIRDRYVNGTTALDAATPSNITTEVLLGENVELERPFIPTPQLIADAHDALRMGLWNLPATMFNGKKNGNK